MTSLNIYSNKIKTNNSPSQSRDWLTSNGYFMSPSTRPGVSMKVTRGNLRDFEVLISVLRKSVTPGTGWT